jgi:hypothetical protein
MRARWHVSVRQVGSACCQHSRCLIIGYLTIVFVSLGLSCLAVTTEFSNVDENIVKHPIRVTVYIVSFIVQLLAATCGVRYWNDRNRRRREKDPERARLSSAYDDSDSDDDETLSRFGPFAIHTKGQPVTVVDR